VKPRLFIVSAASLIGLGLAIWWWFGRPKPAPDAGQTVALPAQGLPLASAPGGAAVPVPAQAPAQENRISSAVTPGAPLVRTIASRPPASGPGASPPAPQPERADDGRGDVEGIRLMLRDYRTRLGENPVGSNAEIMKAIMGGNPIQAVLGPPPGLSLNAAGELVDRWGTPYFFHQLSKDTMEIRSAGPDRVMWTGDDVVGR
jgi:hypothetical protein